MIIIKDLAWSNWFSYGEGNYINFEEPVLQVMGLNGAGKTSIPLILQEVFYGKNSKGKKKTSLINRYLDKPTLTAICNFEDEKGNKYKIDLSRKSTLKLKLFRNGEDISSHTTTNTYKTIEGIIGLDFKTFSQLIYQSSTDNLEFLTATDSNRKKFLIGLFALNKYLEILESFKSVSSEITSDLTSLNSKVSTIEAWINKHEGMNFTEKNIEEIPELDDSDVEKLGALQSSLSSISATNKKINQNNQYKSLLEGLDTSILSESVDTALLEKKDEMRSHYDFSKSKQVEYNTKVKTEQAKVSKINKLSDTCISCGQSISSETKESMLSECKDTIDTFMDEISNIEKDLDILSGDLMTIRDIESKVKAKEKVSNELVKLRNSIDDDLPSTVLNQQEIQSEINEINERISKVKSEITRISKSNTEASAHNSRIKVILEQLDEHRKEAESHMAELFSLNTTSQQLELIKRALSPSGLLSYKLDYLVKDLEKEINSYLGRLSSGKFQLIFKLENEKLNIEIIDEGMSVSIEELSAGELARINAATLLAIRKLMAAISSTKINILFLDEIMGVLDEGGKEMLIDVLHNEKDLNTLLVSHEYSHPLIPKITIVKEKNISRIENE